MKNINLKKWAIITISSLILFFSLRVVSAMTAPTFQDYLQTELEEKQKDWEDWDFKQSQAESIANDCKNKKIEIENNANKIRALLADFQ